MPTYAGIFVAGLVVGVLIGWGVTASRSSNTKVATTANSSTSAATTNTNSNTGAAAAVTLDSTQTTSAEALTVPSPQAAGPTAAISHVTVTQPTWVVVYDSANGAPGKALGATLFAPGKTSGTVTLLRATTPASSYFVGERVDNGDKQFTPATDPVVNDASGKRLLVPFKTN